MRNAAYHFPISSRDLRKSQDFIMLTSVETCDSRRKSVNRNAAKALK
jgi:hypothetical protein